MANNLRLQVIMAAVDRVTRPLQAIRTGSSTTGQRLQQLRDNLRRLQQQQADIQSFRQLQEASRTSGAALQAQREKIRALSAQLASAPAPTKRMTAEFQRAMREGHRLRETFAQQQRGLQTLQQQLAAAGVDTRALGAHELRLRRQIEAGTRSMDQQQAAMARLARQQEKLAKARAAVDRAKATGSSLAAKGSMVAAGGGGMLAVMAAQGLETQRSGAKLAAQLGQGADQARQYRDIITSVYSGGFGDSIGQVAEALGNVSSSLGSLEKSGADGLASMTRQATALAQAFDLDLPETVNMAAIMVQNKLAGSSTEAFDLITRGMQGVSVSMRQELPEIIHEYSTNFRALGFTGKDAFNLLTAAAAQGKFALDKTGDALKEFTLRASDGSKSTDEAYKAIGLNAKKMAKGIAVGGAEARQVLMQTVNALLKVKNPANRAQQAIALFGTPLEDLSVDQIPAFLRGLTGIDDRMGTVSGAADQLASTLQDNTLDALTRIQRLLSGEVLRLMEQYEDDIKGIVQSVTDWMQANPELVSTLAKVAVIVAGVAAVGGTLAVIMAGLIGPFAMARLAMTTFGVATGVSFGPIMLIIGAIAALAAGAYLIWSNWGTLGPKFAAIWQSIRSGLSELMGWLMTKADQFYQFGANMMQGLVSGITGALGSVRDAVVGAGTAAVGWFKETLGIHSPSRVFAELGGYTMAGLQQGIQRGEQGPLRALSDTVSQLTAAGQIPLGLTGQAARTPLTLDRRPPLTPAQLNGTARAGQPVAGQTAGGPITIIVNPSQGMSEAELARLVARQVERITLGEQARRRSRQTDLE